MVADVPTGNDDGHSATTITAGQNRPLRSRVAMASPRIKRGDGTRFCFCNSRWVPFHSFDIILLYHGVGFWTLQRHFVQSSILFHFSHFLIGSFSFFPFHLMSSLGTSFFYHVPIHRISSISFNVISIITDIIGFIIMSTKPGDLIDLTIADRTSDIVLSLFLLCSLSGIIGAIFYETVWVAIPRIAYVIKAILAALTGVFVANVVSSAGHDITLTIILSFLGERRMDILLCFERLRYS